MLVGVILGKASIADSDRRGDVLWCSLRGKEAKWVTDAFDRLGPLSQQKHAKVGC